MSSSGAIGAAGEALVARRLEGLGYRIVARNWRARGGELDIVALDGDILVFVEVRVRTGTHLGSADESVDPAKLARLFSTANMFVVAFPEYQDTIWRVDLVAVTLAKDGAIVACRHYENVTPD